MSESQKTPFIDLSMTQVAGGALAAATAAAAGSRLGVAGTIVGAALISVVSAVAAAFYSASLRRTREIVKARERLQWRGNDTRSMPPVAAELDPANDALDEAVAARRRIPWPKVAIAAIAVFVLSIGAVTGLELVTGRSLDGGSRTTLTPAIAPAEQSDTPRDDSGTEPTEQPTESATEQPSDDGSAPAEENTVEPSEAPSPTAPTTPTPTPTPTPSVPVPTPTPTG